MVYDIKALYADKTCKTLDFKMVYTETISIYTKPYNPIDRAIILVQKP